MATPARYDLKVYEGDDTILAFQWKDVNGIPKDLGTSSIKLGAKRAYTDAALLFSVTGQIINAPLGKFAVVIPSGVTTGVTGGKVTDLVYDIEIILPSGLIQTLFHGYMIVQPEVYR